MVSATLKLEPKSYTKPVGARQKLRYSVVEPGDIRKIEYLYSYATEFESIYGARLASFVLQQPVKKIERRRESLSVLKPEIMGLGLGGVVSFGVIIFALATHNPGLATVMAGPFVASILGFALLFFGVKRKR